MVCACKRSLRKVEFFFLFQPTCVCVVAHSRKIPSVKKYVLRFALECCCSKASKMLVIDDLAIFLFVDDDML